jgi:hypothetical protein
MYNIYVFCPILDLLIIEQNRIEEIKEATFVRDKYVAKKITNVTMTRKIKDLHMSWKLTLPVFFYIIIYTMIQKL